MAKIVPKRIVSSLVGCLTTDPIIGHHVPVTQPRSKHSTKSGCDFCKDSDGGTRQRPRTPPGNTGLSVLRDYTPHPILYFPGC